MVTSKPLWNEDLGIYESLKDNLQNIETSFQEAVAQEVRSQNMRTELITNVSHDLKNSANLHDQLHRPSEKARIFRKRSGCVTSQYWNPAAIV